MVQLFVLSILALGLTLTLGIWIGRVHASRHPREDPRIAVYEDLILQIAADDVGDPALEARLLLQKTRRRRQL